MLMSVTILMFGYFNDKTDSVKHKHMLIFNHFEKAARSILRNLGSVKCYMIVLETTTATTVSTTEGTTPETTRGNLTCSLSI